MTTHSNNTKLRRGTSLPSRFVLRALLATLSIATGLVRLGATEYVYGIGTDWNLYQISIDGSTVSTAVALNLSGYVEGFGTHNNEHLDGLGIDVGTGDIYFNYSYNNKSKSTSGTMTVVPYIYQNVNGTYRMPYALGSAITSSTLSATDVGAGWLPRGTYYNGAYYLGQQLSDTMVALPITGSSTKSYSSVNTYSNWDHTSATSLNGGDFVIGTNNVIYGSASVSNANQFYRQQLTNATNSAGSAWTIFNVDASIPMAVQGTIQVAGLGQSTNLYVVSSTGRNLYQVSGYDSVSAPAFAQIGSNGVIPVTMTDLSVVVTAPLPVPETSTVMGGAAAAIGAGFEAFRWIRRQRQNNQSA